jgi:hypothetical protein
MEHYLTTQRSTIFQHVGVLIYVFDVESREMDKDLQYYVDCLKSLSTFSPDAGVFVLVHKMDLVRGDRQAVFRKKKNELQAAGGDAEITVFGTSIWDESLYKASSAGPLPFVFADTASSFAGLVSNSTQPDPQCPDSRTTSCHFRRGMWRNRGCALRTHHISGHRYIVARRTRQYRSLRRGSY